MVYSLNHETTIPFVIIILTIFSICNSNTIVGKMLAALVENSDKSVGGTLKSVGAPVEDTTSATGDTAAADFFHHLVKPHGKTANFLGFLQVVQPHSSS